MATYDNDNPKEFAISGNHRQANGKSYLWVQCPFCFDEFKAYLWSLSGGGKKCPACGAMHYSSGVAHQEIKKEPAFNWA